MTEQEVTIRRAVRSDARELAGMRWDRAAEDQPLDPDDRETFLDRQLTWFAEALENGWVAWVLEQDNRLCGQVFVNVVDTVPSPVPGPAGVGYVTNLWVAPGLRGQRRGAELLEAAREWAVTVPLASLVVRPSAEATALFTGAGFRDGGMLHLPLTPGA
ncbi:GNAT family N-acetyltransferase [Nocardioides mesophilus]|uniref:GNAT family N-acetyltransferase n=1 Tax=Nocardioides mesophilus TaxID=433659 RepID=A0A7G9RBF9_9ACTN|nr:GNAT family N-acetyltransferase [Nocardioides mesophilus]QNN52934.1 GNAT family N-acetyltransferase [Nocardioides mesophilus]